MHPRARVKFGAMLVQVRVIGLALVPIDRSDVLMVDAVMFWNFWG
jgi:hypothetical protein